MCFLSHARTYSCTSLACSGVATLPVPMAHTGSYAITIALQSCRKNNQSRTQATGSYAIAIALQSRIDKRLLLLHVPQVLPAIDEQSGHWQLRSQEEKS